MEDTYTMATSVGQDGVTTRLKRKCSDVPLLKIDIPTTPQKESSGEDSQQISSTPQKTNFILKSSITNKEKDGSEVAYIHCVVNVDTSLMSTILGPVVISSSYSEET